MTCVASADKEFLGANSTLGHKEDAKYIAEVIKRYLIEIGPKNIVQICIDNASKMP
jgi:hypothetical protein